MCLPAYLLETILCRRGRREASFADRYYNGVTDIALATPVSVTGRKTTPDINFDLVIFLFPLRHLPRCRSLPVQRHHMESGYPQ